MALDREERTEENGHDDNLAWDKYNWDAYLYDAFPSLVRALVFSQTPFDTVPPMPCLEELKKEYVLPDVVAEDN